MKFVYLNAKTYPGITADHHYVRNLAYAFYKELGDKFALVTINTKSDALPGLKTLNASIPSFLKKTIFFFLWLPFVYISKLRSGNDKVVFFSNDLNLLSILIFWKKILWFSYIVAADWHLLTETGKDKYVANNADYSFTTSAKLERAIRNLAPNAKTATAYGGVDLESFRPEEKRLIRRELGLPENDFLVGYAGYFLTMGMEKGLSTMIFALKNLPPKYVMVFVGGKFEEMELYKKEAEDNGVLDRCLFFPVQKFENLIRFEQAMDALAIPYPDKPHFRNYGFPMKIYEYMASGVPIIYTKLELLEEVASDCAWGIAPDSPEELAKAVVDIDINKDEVSKKTQSALEKVSGFTWAKRAQNIIKTFDIL